MGSASDSGETAAFLEHFDRLEEQVALLVERAAELKAENLELKGRISHLEEELNQKREAEARWSEERARVRARIDHVLARLEGVNRS